MASSRRVDSAQLRYLLPSIGSELWALLSVDALWGLALLAAGWFLTSVISGRSASAVNVIFLAYGVWQIWGTIRDTYSLLRSWFWGSTRPRQRKELDEAGKHFAEGLAKGDSRSLRLLVTHKALRFASRKLAAKYPPPERLRERFAEEQRKAQIAKESTGVQANRQRRSRRRAASEATPKERRRWSGCKDLRRTVEARGGMELGQDLSKNLQTRARAMWLQSRSSASPSRGLFALAAAASQEDEQPESGVPEEEERAMSERKEDAALAALAVVGTVLTLRGFAVAVALSRRVAENRFHPRVSHNQTTDPISSAGLFGRRDVEAAARMLARRKRAGKSAALDRADWDSASCAKAGETLYERMTAGSGYGRQRIGHGRQDSSSVHGSEALPIHQSWAREVLSGLHTPRFGNAIAFFDPDQQDKAYAIAQRARAKQKQGLPLTEQEKRLSHYRKTAAEVRADWRRPFAVSEPSTEWSFTK